MEKSECLAVLLFEMRFSPASGCLGVEIESSHREFAVACSRQS
jgi:hypothetical protein